ncbi:unnamed protein product, partial [Polarella glacialis]
AAFAVLGISRGEKPQPSLERTQLVGLCAAGLDGRFFQAKKAKAWTLRAAAVNGSDFVVARAREGLEVSRSALVNMPEAQKFASAELSLACERAGGKQVVLGAGAAGGTLGLCIGALLWSGDLSLSAQQRLVEALQAAKSKNRTAPLARLRRGLRRRLAWVTAASAAATAYLCTLPTIAEGGYGLSAHASGTARRLGRAAAAAGRALWEEPPAPQRRFRPFLRV